MPFAAVADRLAPPARAALLAAAPNVPTVLTLLSASTRKSAGKLLGEAAVAGIPIPSNACEVGKAVGMEIAAEMAMVTSVSRVQTTSARTDRELERMDTL